MRQMKGFVVALVALTVAVGALSCHRTPAPKVVEGVILDATMNNLLVVTSAGDTVAISTMDCDPVRVPGVLVNDSVAVTCQQMSSDGRDYLQATELTVTAHSPYYYIQGTWLEPIPGLQGKQGITLQQDGTAVSVGMATLLFDKWDLLLGTPSDQLVLSGKSEGSGPASLFVDTLQVVRLDADSLVLAKGGVPVWQFGRQE